MILQILIGISIILMCRMLVVLAKEIEKNKQLHQTYQRLLKTLATEIADAVAQRVVTINLPDDSVDVIKDMPNTVERFPVQSIQDEETTIIKSSDVVLTGNINKAREALKRQVVLKGK